MRWNSFAGAGIGIFPELESDPTESEKAISRGGPGGSEHGQNPMAMQPPNGAARRRRSFDDSTMGTLEAVNYIIHALRDLPGRKAVILFSDGITIFGPGGNSRVMEQMQRLTDLANRAAVVIYTVDARGLQTLSITAADHPAMGGAAGQTVDALLASRHRKFFESQGGLDYLARQTGGFFVHDNNDLAGAIRRALDDLSGYYLIGYRPDDSSFAPEKGYRQFHKIQVKVKVRGLQVRSRTGYLGIPDEESRPVYRTSHEQLLARLVSPFTSGDLTLRLTCLLTELPKVGAAVRSLLYIDPHNFTYTLAPDGSHNTKFDMVVLAFGEQGNIVGSADGTFTARLTPEEHARAMRSGFLYTMDVELEKPGGYQVRAAVRDTASERSDRRASLSRCRTSVSTVWCSRESCSTRRVRKLPLGIRPAPRKITALPVPARPPFGCSAWARRSPTATRSTTQSSRAGSPRSKRSCCSIATQNLSTSGRSRRSGPTRRSMLRAWWRMVNYASVPIWSRASTCCRSSLGISSRRRSASWRRSGPIWKWRGSLRRRAGARARMLFRIASEYTVERSPQWKPYR